MSDDLKERLKSHARAFDSLLSLIPAKLYYGEDVSDQWQRKKQTPEQKRAAKLAKLDPDNWKSAKDVMDDKEAAALKRKRDTPSDAEDHDSDADPSHTAQELPKAARDSQRPQSKKRKTDVPAPESEATEEEKKRRKAEAKAAKRERKHERKTKARDKKERQKAKKQAQAADTAVVAESNKPELILKDTIRLGEGGAVRHPAGDEDTSVSSDQDPPEVFSPPHDSGTSSTSSILPLSATVDYPIKQGAADTPSHADAPAPTLPPPRERLQAAISQLRADRKADGSDGRPPKNRQELLDQRRRKEEERKAAKKEQKRREKEEEARRQDEEIAKRFSPGGSGSLLASPRSPVVGDRNSSANSFSFGRVAFGDGTHLDPTASTVVGEHAKKGPRDAAAELQIAMAKKQRLAGLDEAQRRDIEQKDMWLNAKRRAHGEHVRDDTSLLKKALKRQQGQKKKSEREWGDRLQGVQRAQEARQKKRTENLAKRKEEKHAGGKKSSKVRRPGFEGSFKGRTGGKRKA